MQRSFPLFQSHLDFAHTLWKMHLKPGDWAIDATCGHGWDTAQLAELVGPKGGVIAIDLQEEAIYSARKRFSQESPVHFFHQSHDCFPLLSQEKPIRLIVYNLGYLPGNNKKITTLVETTLTSVKAAMGLLQPGGFISLTCYPGHPEGAREEAALVDLARLLDPKNWSSSHHKWENRCQSPSLLLIQKNFI